MKSDTSSETVLLHELGKFDSATLSNAIEAFGLRPRNQGFASLKTRCLFPELGNMVGYAVTAQAETMTESDPDRCASLPLYEAVMKSPKPAIVVIEEIGPRPEYATHCGEVMATILGRLGAVGLVTDSAVRDIPELRAMHFHVFARGGVPSHAYFRIVRVGIPIHVQDLPIRPYDVLHGDENGLIVIPGERLEELSREADAVRAREHALMEYVRGTEFTLEGLRRRLEMK